MGDEDWKYITGTSSNYYTATQYQNQQISQQYDYWKQLQSIDIQPGKIYPMPELQQLKEGIEMKGLYDVYLVYAEDRKAIVKEVVTGVLADSDEDAKIKSGLMKEIKDDWDAR